MALPSAQEKRTDKRTEMHTCDLISRQALCEYALNQKDKNITANNIMRFPFAQPERKRGRWIPNIYPDVGDGYRCSQCGAYHVVPYKFCHNCGSDNRGERND